MACVLGCFEKVFDQMALHAVNEAKDILCEESERTKVVSSCFLVVLETIGLDSIHSYC